MAQGRGVEEDLGVGEVLVARLGPERAQDALEVADPHVVGDEGHVLAGEAPLGQDQVARRGLQRALGIEPLIDPAARPAQALHLQQPPAPELAQDPARVAAAAAHVDVQAEQVLRRLGEDLRQAHGALGPAGGHGVLAARALEEDEPLEHVGRHVRRPRGALDGGPPARGALGAGLGAAGRERVERVARARRRAPLEVPAPVVAVGEGVGQRRRLAIVAHVGRRRHDRDAARQEAVVVVGDQRAEGDENQQDAGEQGGAARVTHRLDPKRSAAGDSGAEPPAARSDQRLMRTFLVAVLWRPSA